MNEIINFGEKKRVKIIMLKGEKGDKGEDGSSGDYSALTNKPKINDIEINGNMTASDLGLVSETEFEQSQTVTDTSIDRIKESFATVEPSSESAHAYAVGQYLVYNGYLYKTLQAISIGDTLNDTAPSGNIALVTVADELNAIQSDVADAQTDIGTLQTDMTTTQSSVDSNTSRIDALESSAVHIAKAYKEFSNITIASGASYTFDVPIPSGAKNPYPLYCRSSDASRTLITINMYVSVSSSIFRVVMSNQASITMSNISPRIEVTYAYTQ